MVTFYGFDPFFGPNETPLAPRWTLGGPHHVKFDFLRKIDDPFWGSQKFEFWGMVTFYGFDPFFGPNETPLAPRWTLGGPHHDLAP